MPIDRHELINFKQWRRWVNKKVGFVKAVANGTNGDTLYFLQRRRCMSFHT